MQNPNLNLLIFDDEQEPSHSMEIKKYTSLNKNSQPSHGNKNPANDKGPNSQKNMKKDHSNNIQSQQIVFKQISQLNQKIKQLERQEQKMKYQIQKNNQCNPSSMNNNNYQKFKQIQQILMVVQKKIQIVIQQSKKIVSKFNQVIQKKFHQVSKINQNQNIKIENNSDKYKDKLENIENAFRQKLNQYQRYYKSQYQKIVKQNKHKEETMMKRLSQIQLKFMNKLNTFQTKQKQYVDWIHHLQGKLKQRKSKKMITITQQKPQLSPIPSKNSIVSNQNGINQTNIQNIPAANLPNSKINCSIDQNNSKVVRKHKIFGQKSSSPAPNNYSTISPSKDTLSKIGQSKVNNYEIRKNQNLVHNNLVKNSKIPQQQSKLQNQSINGNENLKFYSQLKKQSSKQFGYDKNIPQRQTQEGWDKFADINQFSQEYNESESDDFFTPIDSPQHGNYERILANIPLDSQGGTYYGQDFKNQKLYQNNFSNQASSQKVFSPFDLN